MNDVFMKAQGESEKKVKKYRVLLLDADGTILDFEKANRFAFSQFIQDMEIADSDESYDLFCRINHLHWADYELGKTGMDELSAKIYGDFFSAVDLKNHGFEDANRRFMSHLAQAG